MPWSNTPMLPHPNAGATSLRSTAWLPARSRQNLAIILLDWTQRCDGLLEACPAARRREQHGSAHPQHVEHVDAALALRD